MSSTIRTWAEIIFNIAYLITIWVLVAKMFRKVSVVRPKDLSVAKNITLAFVLLAIGDTGHVGFRVLSFGLESLESSFNLLNLKQYLTGAGSLATAITITLFYVVILDTWRKRFDGKYGALEYVLIVAAIVRLIMFLNTGNRWNSEVPPFGWSVARNIPLMVQGLGVAYIILRDAIKRRDKVFKWIGIMILVSYAFYMPVIFLIQRLPWVGMLMIPKTIAYVAIALITYREFFYKKMLRLVKPEKAVKDA